MNRIEVSRRGFMGVVVTSLVPAADGQGEVVEARIHVGGDGVVTVMNGKVEEGQGARVELAMAAAEEMGIAVERVRVQMADTGRTPNDGITAGSRTTPATVPAVRRAAAAARRLVKDGGPAGGVLGRGRWRGDAREVVTGELRFPGDVVRAGMLYGVVARAPGVGMKLKSAEVEAARALGAVAVREGDFAGCAAKTSYEARKAVAALGATWSGGATGTSATLYADLKARAREKVAPLEGRTHSGEFRTAYIQHAPMEPRAAVAEWTGGKLTVWTGTSNPFNVRDELAREFGLQAADVRVIVPDFGGGFGGKHTGEAATEAARLARAAGKPVQVRWTRGEEFQWAYCRPAALIEIDAALEGGAIRAWQMTNFNAGGAGLGSPYRIGDKREKYVTCDAPLRQGSYRALAATANNFAREAFMDELAAAAGAEPLEFRLAHLENARMRAVLEAAAERFGWKARRRERRAAGRGIGLACGTEKNSVVAACVEVEVDAKTGVPRLVEIVEAFECGAVLNPWNTKSQVEGCILMGLGAALREEIEYENGRLRNGRFSGYRVTRFKDVPERLEVVLLDRKGEASAGAGETPIIAVAPAMANAMFDAAGKRVRAMPLRVA